MALIRRLPFERNLFIVTPETISLQAQLGDKTLFECETSDGIVNARASKNNSSLIAIADSHLVMLYDVARGRDKKYKLKNGDVSACSNGRRGYNEDIGRATATIVLA